ncbi:MAG TPA: hypothetical protein VEZ11_04270 [Thermoanaerobaculia bacterium]|nr:hypothetical protein [Thermoanaerobaculia bacterium]
MHRCVIALLLGLFLATAAVAQPAFDQLNHDAFAAYKAKDYRRYLDALTKMDALRPGHPSILVKLVGAYSLNAQPDEALAVMKRLVVMSVAFDTRNADFNAIREDPRFAALATQINLLRSGRIAGADVAFHIPEKGLITEGLAYDPENNAFFVSSVRKGKIIRIDRRGQASDFVKSGLEGVHGLSGLGIDAKRKILWGCSTVSPRWEGFHEGDKSAGTLLGFDLTSGALVKRIAPDSAEVFCDDLTVAMDGTVYVSDSTGSILRLAAGSEKLDTLVAHGTIRSPQGSALSADESRLYVADYGGPIRAVDVRTGKVTPLTMPSDFQTMGMDGLTRSGNALIAVQNGIEPNRIVRLDLAADGLTVTRTTILEMNHPLIDEPTIGKMAGNTYYFVGASQGNKFDKGPADPAKLREGLIFSIPIVESIEKGRAPRHP